MKVKIMTKTGHKIKDLNRRKAIRERCLNCSAWSSPEVENCKLIDCQLYPYRSGRGKQNAKARSKAIREYCLWCCCDNSHDVTKCTSSDCPLFAYRKIDVDKSVECA